MHGKGLSNACLKKVENPLAMSSERRLAGYTNLRYKSQFGDPLAPPCLRERDQQVLLNFACKIFRAQQVKLILDIKLKFFGREQVFDSQDREVEKEVSRMLGKNQKLSRGEHQVEQGGWRRFALGSITRGGRVTLAANEKSRVKKWEEKVGVGSHMGGKSKQDYFGDPCEIIL